MQPTPTLAGASTLAKDDVEKMVADAERFAAEDKKKREAVDTKNQAESMIYQTEKQLDEFKEKVPDDVKVGCTASPSVHDFCLHGECSCPGDP